MAAIDRTRMTAKESGQRFRYTRPEFTSSARMKPSIFLLHLRHLDKFGRDQGYKLEESNGFGKRSFMRMVSVLPFKLERITGMSPQNSQMSWRQAPHGDVSVAVSVTTAMASKPRSPSLMALKMATRSAQTVRPYVAFSTLQPPKILPEVARRAAPTRKLEYGAWAFSRACLAATIR